jgi:adenine phosphoribosyltransferase
VNYRDYIRSYPDFPKDGVLFWDFSYLLKDVAARNSAVTDMKTFLADKNIDKIAAIEAKGFTLGAILAHELNLPLVLIRKPHRTPGRLYQQPFVKEYGTDAYELKADALETDERIAIVYDIMAGSGASKAAISLVQQCGAQVAALVYAIELAYLGGRQDLASYDIHSLVTIRERDDTVS